jgi:hypothetical protein
MLYYLIICKYLDYKSYFKFRSVSRYILNNSIYIEQEKRNIINLYYTEDKIKKNKIKFNYNINEFNFCKLIKPIYIYIKNTNIDLTNNILYTNNCNTIKFFLNLKNNKIIKCPKIKTLNFSKNTYNQYVNFSLQKHNMVCIRFNYLNGNNNYIENIYFNKNVLLKLIGFKIEKNNYYTAIYNLLKIL